MPGLCAAGSLRRSAQPGRRTSSRILGRHSHAVAEHRLDRLALERVAAVIGDLPGHPVEGHALLPGEKLACDSAGVDAQCVKALKLRRKALEARLDHHRRVIGLHQPGHVDEANTVQIAVDERAGLAVVDLRSREHRHLVVQVGANGARLIGLRGEESELRLRVRETAAQVGKVGPGPELANVADPSAEREPLLGKGPAQALGEEVRRLNDHRLAQPARERHARHDASLGVHRKPEGVEARRERRIAVGHIERERRDADSARSGQRRDPRARQRADDHGGAALHGGFVLRENALGPRVGAQHPHRLAVLREDERRLAAEAHGLGRPREIRRIERQQQAYERPFGRGPACRIVDGRAQCRTQQRRQSEENLGARTGKHGGSPGGAGQLYVVATPIGNLEDISPRALESLTRADAIAAEDTRVTARLLEHYRVRGKLIAVHEHNERRAAGFKVVPVPGPNAAVTALSASGIADGPFLFAGFLPARPAERRKALARLAGLPYTLVLYEAPHRVVECVEDMSAALGPGRTLVIARELTKLFEQIHRCSLGEAAAWLREDADRRRGEFVLIAEGPAARNESAKPDWERVLTTLLGELPLAHAVKLACKLTGAKKNAVYARALQLARAANSRRS